jgi:hypothetical protein
LTVKSLDDVSLPLISHVEAVKAPLNVIVPSAARALPAVAPKIAAIKVEIAKDFIKQCSQECLVSAYGRGGASGIPDR